jgi:pyruvate/2-oxoglutarate dehydrogenase complex dihydrolipoamide acyltransferase (E2) component
MQSWREWQIWWLMPEIVYVTIPQETVNDESVRILSWKIPSGSKVEKDQQLCEIETSKAVMDIEAPEAGTVVYTAKAGDEVPVGSTICQIVPEGMAAPAPVDAVAEPAAVETESKAAQAKEPAPTPEPEKTTQSIAPPTAAPKSSLPSDKAVDPQIDEADLPPARLTPLAAKLAEEFGFAKESFARGSLVRRDDVLRRAGKLPAEAPTQPSAAPAPAPTKAAPAEPVENVPVAGVGVNWTDLPRRKTFEAKILSQGQARTVQSQVTTSVRTPRLRARLERLGLSSLGLGALTIFETARLLRKYPEFNAIHDRGRIGIYADVNIGWAIDSGAPANQGLMVPVVPQADQKTPAEIVEVMQRHVDSYVENKLATSDFLGGTFTISDLSGDGISHFNPLISQGQAAILGVGGELDIAGNETLYLTLAFDHQLAEGRKAAQFVRELAQRLEAHAALEPAPVQPAPAQGEPYCSLCQRDREALKSIRGILVKSEIPAGYVCSVCLAELS